MSSYRSEKLQFPNRVMYAELEAYRINIWANVFPMICCYDLCIHIPQSAHHETAPPPPPPPPDNKFTDFPGNHSYPTQVCHVKSCLSHSSSMQPEADLSEQCVRRPQQAFSSLSVHWESCGLHTSQHDPTRWDI